MAVDVRSVPGTLSGISRSVLGLRYFTVKVSRKGCSCNGCPVRDIAVMVMVIVEVPEGVMIGG